MRSSNYLFIPGYVLTLVAQAPASATCADVAGAADYVLTPEDVAAINAQIVRMNALQYLGGPLLQHAIRGEHQARRRASECTGAGASGSGCGAGNHREVWSGDPVTLNNAAS